MALKKTITCDICEVEISDGTGYGLKFDDKTIMQQCGSIYDASQHVCKECARSIYAIYKRNVVDPMGMTI